MRPASEISVMGVVQLKCLRNAENIYEVLREGTQGEMVFTGSYNKDFPDGLAGKVSTYNVGDSGSIPGSGRSSGEGNGNPLQYSCLENPMDGGAWWATVHGVAKSRTRLSD